MLTTAKLGFYSWFVDLPSTIKDCKPNPLNEPTMIVGADVSHDRKISQSYLPLKGRHSCCGFSASYDKHFTQYASWMSYQTKNIDKLQEAQICMEEALKMFYSKNGCYPSNVIIYRYVCMCVSPGH